MSTLPTPPGAVNFPPEPQPAPDPLAEELARMLLAVWAEGSPVEDAQSAAQATAPQRARLLQRVHASAQAARAMHTRRHATAPCTAPAPGVQLRTLYAAGAGTPRRGEPLLAALVEMAPGSVWNDAASGALQRECLVLRGSVRAGDTGSTEQGAEDFLLWPAGCAQPPLQAGPAGAQLLWRTAPAGAAGWPGTVPLRQSAAAAPWQDYGPGIVRRVLWQHEGQAALLYRAAPGAAVPCHGHGHDEECFMLQGDVFLDDVLLRALDYQLAPAGSRHRSVSTDTGAVLYAHGDAELDLQPE